MSKAHKTSIEIEGKTIEDAVTKAVVELNVPRDRVKIEVLVEEEKGLFGMPGARLAKVRATIKNT